MALPGPDHQLALLTVDRLAADGVLEEAMPEPVDEDALDMISPPIRDHQGVDLTLARRLPANARVAFVADQNGGPFDISGSQAREWLILHCESQFLWVSRLFN